MHTRRIVPLLIAAAAAALTFSACSATGAPSGPEGIWGTPDEPGAPGLEFDAATDGSGEYHGNDGCNSIGGTFTVEEDQIDLGVMRATMMYCEGVDTWLSQAQTAKISGNTMTFLDASGAEIGELARHAE